MLDALEIPLTWSHAQSGHFNPCLASDLTTNVAHDFQVLLFLHRDPRDTVVSGWYQKKFRRDGYPGTISDFVRDPYHGIHKIVVFNRMWFDFANANPAALVVAYEDLASTTHQSLHRIVNFLGFARSEEQLAQSVNEGQFDLMKTREKQGFYAEKYGSALKPLDMFDDRTYKVRRGVVGGYAQELSREDIGYCNSVLKENAYFRRLNMEH